MWHDIYQVDQEENPPIGKQGLIRIPKDLLTNRMQ